MAEAEYLTPAERGVLESKGLRRRAKAIQAFLGVAEQLDLAHDQVSSVVEGIRQAEPGSWRQLNVSFGHIGVFLASLPPREGEGEALVLESEVASMDATLASTSSEVVTEVLEQEIAPEATAPEVISEVAFGEQAMRALRRFTGCRTLTDDMIIVKDVEAILNMISDTKHGTPLTTHTRSVLRQVLLGVPSKEVQGSVSAVGNTQQAMAISETGQSELLQRLTGAVLETASSNSHQAEAVEATPMKKAPALFVPKPRPPATPPVYVTNVVEREPRDELDAILRDSIEKPSIVTAREWEGAAHRRFIEVSEKADLAEAERDELWAWIHFDENGETPLQMGEDGKKALNNLQKRFFSTDKSHFNNHPHQNVAARTLVVTANGIKRLEDICSKIRQLKLASAMTDSVAQRHVVAAVTHLLSQEQR